MEEGGDGGRGRWKGDEAGRDGRRRKWRKRAIEEEDGWEMKQGWR